MPDDKDKQQLTHWLRFFMDGGIPSANAVTYAVTFVENRIEKDMIAELTKEYLQEMGIKPLGDIISILRQAKKVLQPKPMEIPTFDLSPPAAEPPREEQKRPISDTESPPKRRAKTENRFQEKKAESKRAASPDTLSVDSESPIPEGPEPPAHLIVEPPTTKAPTGKSSLIKSTTGKLATTSVSPVVASLSKVSPVRLSGGPISGGRSRVVMPVQAKQMEEVPIQKKRRVLPEHEGGYKIKMPEGTTPKTAKILAQGKLVSDSPQSRSLSTTRVFDRLGQAKSKGTRTPTTKSERAQAAVNPPGAQASSESSEEEVECHASAEESPPPNIEFRVTGLRNFKLTAEPEETTVKPPSTRLKGQSTVKASLTTGLTTIKASPRPMTVEASPRPTTVKTPPSTRPAPVGGVFNRLGASSDRLALSDDDVVSSNPDVELEDDEDVAPYVGVLKNRERLSLPATSSKHIAGLKRTFNTAETPTSSTLSRSIRGRLGDNTVSSSSDVKSSKSLSTKNLTAAARLGVKRSAPGAASRLRERPNESRVSTTVFSRLGANK